MDFYSHKSRELPRFLFRNFSDVLERGATPEQRAQYLQQVVEFIDNLKLSGDWQKMKWTMPPRLSAILTDQEKATLEHALQHKGARRNQRLLEVYPHCSDEFSTEVSFLDAAFGNATVGLISKDTKILTIGSCFANNIAQFLQSKDYQVQTFPLAEDLNSPFSNAKLLSICAADDKTQQTYITYWVNALFPNDPGVDACVRIEVDRLRTLRNHLQASNFIIITCGNVLDYFIPRGDDGFESGPSVAPKFLSVGQNEDIEMRQNTSRILKEKGATFRMGNHDEVMEAMEALYRSVRTINPTAHLLFTLSPVPIDSAVGIQHVGHHMGAIEMDCISKSLLRVALAEKMNAWKDDAALHYFPSFEIVRWVGSCMNGAVFGAEDAASRHVSQTILSGVYRYFLHKFCADEAAQTVSERISA